MALNSRRVLTNSRYASFSHTIVIFLLLLAITSPYLVLPFPATANARITARNRGVELGQTAAAEHATGKAGRDLPNMTERKGVLPPAQASPSPGRLIYQTRPSGFGINMINPDGTNRVNLTDYGAGVLDRPSVSEQTGTVAFEAAGLSITPPLDFQDHRIFVMNGDGTGIKQITFPPNPGSNALNTLDSHPKISPDGTKVAFVSLRTQGQTHQCTNSSATTTTNKEVWVVNVNGSNLHQVTFPLYLDRSDNVCLASDNAEVAWSPDSTQLIVMGTRPYSFVNSARLPGIFNSLSMVSAGGGAGGAGTLFAIDLPDPNPNFGEKSEPVTYAHVQPRDGNGIGFLDWSSTGSILFSAFVNGQSGSLGQMAQGGQPSYRLTQDVMGSGGLIFSACYSPDGAHILIEGRSSSTGDNNDHLFIDGSGGLVPNTGSPAVAGGVEWAPGPGIPKPNKLVLTPNPLVLYGQTPVRVTPTVLDADGNVIVRATEWSRDGAGFRCDNTADEIPCVGVQPLSSNQVDFTSLVKGTTSELQGNLCGVNAFIMGCTPYFNTQSSAFLSITATTGTAFTSGTGGPGVLNIKREGAPPNMPPIAITFAVSGTAVRDVDYTLDFTGNTITLPSGQISVNINVRPLRAQTADKTIIITLQADPLKNYIISQFFKSSATVTIKNDIVGKVLSLTNITPNSGGDQGVVQANVYGLNIEQGATVKLARSGQADIIGEGIFVQANGSSITVTFNLIGKLQGAWDVVVTNPDNTSARLTGGFTIQPVKQPHIWLDISGRDAIRASHTATTYTLTYGNSGNVDAYVVPLFIMGVPLNAEFKLLFNPAQIAGVTNPNLSPIFQSPTDQRLLLFLPVVRANSTNYLRFTLRASSFPDGSFELQALAAMPLYKPLPNPASPSRQPRGGTSQIRQFADNASLVDRNIGADDTSFSSFLLSGSPEAYDCLNSVLGLLLNCGSVVIPGLGLVEKGSAAAQCIASALNFTAGLDATLITAHQNNDQLAPLAPAQIVTGAAGSAADCLEAFGRGIPGLGSFLGALSCATSVGDTLATCYSDYKKYKARTIGSVDPNQKVGLRGLTPENYINGTQSLDYSVFFENLATATAPAQTVIVTDQLDVAKMDLSTFSLGLIGFGSTVVTPPPGLQSYSADVDLRPTKNLIVRIQASLNQATGVVTWRFDSIDPTTNQPTTDPTAGFLPPDTDGLMGQGSVLFTVMPKSGLAAGMQISNKATITFDLNAPIDTNTFTNTIDNSLPKSHVGELNSAQPFVIFLVKWSGTDTGSGVRDYTGYVSENGGAYAPWVYHTTQTSAYYIGKPGRTYSFHTIATDNANNQEALKTMSEAGTATRTDITNSIDDSRFLVWQHYRDFLNRQPDDSGFDFWTNQVESCGAEIACREVKRINVSASFFLSIEFQQTGYLVERIYKSAYGSVNGTSTLDGTHQLSVPVVRLGEFVPDMLQIGRGVIVLQAGWEQQLENNKQAFVADFVGRSRFITAFPTTLTPAQFVDQLFNNAGFVPSAAERSAAINEFGSATTSSDVGARARTLRRVAESSTLIQQEFNRAFVLMQYFGYLRRNPNDAPEATLDYTGYDFWLTKLNQFNGNYINAEMVKAFLTSIEYRQRFAP